MQGGRYRAVAHLPTSIIGWVIGHKGCNARMLKQQTGTELWVDVPGQVGCHFNFTVRQKLMAQLQHSSSMIFTTILALLHYTYGAVLGHEPTTGLRIHTFTLWLYLCMHRVLYRFVPVLQCYAWLSATVCHHRIAGRAGGGGGHGSRQRLRQNRSHLHRQGPGNFRFLGVPT